MEERKGVVTFKGSPVTLSGRDLGVGEAVGEFTLLGPDLAPVGSAEFEGKTVLFNVVLSLDTGICSAQTRRFNEELETLPKSVEVVTVSADLPFAQSRFAVAEKIRHRLLSDYRDFSFAQAFGLGIKELRLLARAIFVVDQKGVVTYRQIVPEATHHPRYEEALAAVK